ncbi:hypothetical protein WUBG_14529, partial [Wuchereria bancrofti]
ISNISKDIFVSHTTITIAVIYFINGIYLSSLVPLDDIPLSIIFFLLLRFYSIRSTKHLKTFRTLYINFNLGLTQPEKGQYALNEAVILENLTQLCLLTSIHYDYASNSVDDYARKRDIYGTRCLFLY